jgi:putative ABC transport system permease protein
MISIAYIIREILAEKTRFFLILLAVAWGTASITGMLAVGEGLRLTFSRAIASSGSALLYVTTGQTTKSYHGQAINQVINLTQQDLQNLRTSIPTIQVLPEYNFSTPIIYNDKKSFTSISGVEPLYGNWRNITPQSNGRFINASDMQQRQQVIVLGNDVAKQLFGNNKNPIGSFISIGNKRFQVIGIR